MTDMTFYRKQFVPDMIIIDQLANSTANAASVAIFFARLVFNWLRPAVVVQRSIKAECQIEK